MLKSKRQSNSIFKSNILRCSGHVDSYDTREFDGKFGSQTKVFMKVSKLTVKETEPGTTYPYDVADLPIGSFSDSDVSAYGKFEASIDKALGLEPNTGYIDLIVGKNVELIQHPKEADNKFSKEWWEVVSVNGVGAKSSGSPMDTFVAMLEGKKKGDVIAEAVSNQEIKQDSNLVQSILSGVVFNDAKVTGKYDLVNDVFVKKS